MICIKAEEVLADVRSAGWLEQELHPELDRHRRHQMADICEEGNVERVWRVLGNGVAEVRMALARLLKPEVDIASANELARPEVWRFAFAQRLPEATYAFLREKIHEYLVATVMADRCAVIIPASAEVWRLRAEDALGALRQAAAVGAVARVRRPMWPW